MGSPESVLLSPLLSAVFSELVVSLPLVSSFRTGAGDQTGDHYEDKQKRDQLFHWLFSL